MKYTISLLFLLPMFVFAQQVDILLIGVSHNYGKYPSQDFSKIYGKIKAFEPDAVFGEFLSKADEENNADYWCKEDNIKRLTTLRKNRAISAEQLPRIIDSLKKQAIANPKDYKLKVDLAHAYYLNQDVSNAHYQYWQVYDQINKNPNEGLETYVQQILRPDLDNSGRSMKRLETSEYAMIAFPMMQVLGIEELTPMDCQDYDLNWSAAALAFYNKFEPYKKDVQASYYQALQTVLTKRDKGFEKFGKIERESKQVTEWLNTDEASTIAASGDFYYPELYELPGFPKEEMHAQLHWWLMRNKVMCENVVNRARALKRKKVLVIVGANHRKFMQDIFVEMPDVLIKNINEME